MLFWNFAISPPQSLWTLRWPPPWCFFSGVFLSPSHPNCQHLHMILSCSFPYIWIEQEYFDGVIKFYHTTVESVDFRGDTEKSRQEINFWVESQCQGKKGLAVRLTFLSLSKESSGPTVQVAHLLQLAFSCVVRVHSSLLDSIGRGWPHPGWWLLTCQPFVSAFSSF